MSKSHSGLRARRARPSSWPPAPPRRLRATGHREVQGRRVRRPAQRRARGADATHRRHHPRPRRARRPRRGQRDRDRRRARRRPRAVEYAEVNRLMRAAVVPERPALRRAVRLEHGQRGSADATSTRPTAGTHGPSRAFPATGGVKVGIVDTGIRATHEDLQGKVANCLSASTTDHRRSTPRGLLRRRQRPRHARRRHDRQPRQQRHRHRRRRLQLARRSLQGARRHQRRPHVRRRRLHRLPGRQGRAGHLHEPRRTASDTLHSAVAVRLRGRHRRARRRGLGQRRHDER